MNNRKIRICHITSTHQSNDMRIFQKECISLSKEDDFEVYLIAQGVSRKESNVQVVGLGIPPRGRLARMTSFAKFSCKKALELQADIYHFHDPELLLYARKLKKSGSVVIFDSHEDYPNQILQKEYLPILLRKTISFFYKKFETYVSKSMLDAVIVTSTTNGENPFSNRCRNTIIVDNYPILDSRRFYTSKYTGKKSPTKVCYVGGLTHDRGITNLVQACYTANVQLILAGKFSSEEYKSKLMQSSASKCIDYRGVCTYDEVTEIYREADIGAATLLKVGQYGKMENLPTKTYEYMQMGLPIIMSDTDYNKKLMQKENFAYLVNPEDYIQIANTIKDIVSFPQKAAEKAELARDLINAKYNWNVEVKKLIGLYRKLLIEINSENNKGEF